LHVNEQVVSKILIDLENKSIINFLSARTHALLWDHIHSDGSSTDAVSVWDQRVFITASTSRDVPNVPNQLTTAAITGLNTLRRVMMIWILAKTCLQFK
jgi:hypothetical protein